MVKGKHLGALKDHVQKAKGQPSAFERATVAKKHHSVIGERQRGSRKESATQARARSDQLRRETLLIEHQQRGRTNVFHDGRFGEHDDEMPLEDKLVHRFQRERQRQLRESRYGLEEGGDTLGGHDGSALGAPTSLTHGGRELDMDALSDTGLGDDSDDDFGRGRGRGGKDGGFEGADFVRRAHFGGGDDAEGGGDEGGDRKLSAKELLEETIARYKLAKYERQEVKAEQNKLVDQLDEDFDAIRGLVFAAGAKPKRVPGQPAPPPPSAASQPHGDFEKLASELSREMRAQPSSRLLSEDEAAVAEAKRLRALESERLKRMQPDAAAAASSGSVGGAPGARRRTDDDLDDDLDGGVAGDEGVALTVGGGLAAAGEEEGMGEEDGEEGVSEDDEEGEDDDDDDEEEEEDEDEEEEEEEEEDDDDEGEESASEAGSQEGSAAAASAGDDDDDGGVVVIQPRSARKARPAAAPPEPLAASAAPSARATATTTPAELPYVFACPEDGAGLDELLDGVAGPSAPRQRELLHRLIANHHSKLREPNKVKLVTLASLLLERLLSRARVAATPAEAALLQPLCPSLYTIAQQLPVQCALAILEQLKRVQSTWRAQRRSGAKDGRAARSRLVPLGPDALALVALCVQLFSLSDFRHAVLTPLLVFVSEALAQKALPATGVETRRTLFLCSCALPLLSAAGRWMPELHSTAMRLLEAALGPQGTPSAATTKRGDAERHRAWLGGPMADRTEAVPPPASRRAPGSARGASRSGPATGAAGLAQGPAHPPPRPLTFASLVATDDTGGGGGGGDGDGDDDGSGATMQARRDAAAAVYHLMRDLVAIHEPLPSFVELYLPALRLLTADRPAPDPRPLPAALVGLHDACAAEVRSALQRAIGARAPLRLQRAVVVPIRQLNPAFEDDFQPNRSLDPDRERAEQQKLARKTKKERKGAMRELRKDAAFLATQRDKEKRKRDAYLEGRGKRALAILEDLEHSVKSMKKEKRKLADKL